VRTLRSAVAVAESARQAVLNAAAHPLRTVLGGLAVAVAVATLVLVETAIDGLAIFAEKSAARVFGSETFVVAQIASPGRLSRRELERKLERNPPIRRSDLRFLDRYAGERVVYAATAQRTAEVIAGSRVYENAAVNGTGAALPEIRALGIDQGRFFLPREERRGAQVAVIGHDVAETLFPGVDPLGRTVRIGRRGFEVIGVQEQLGTTGGISLDRYVWMPLLAFERTFGAPETLQVSATAPGGVPLELAEDRARTTLRARRQLAPGVEDNFDLLLPEAARSFVLSLVERIGAVSPILSLAALLAAVVVVANTTLVSVVQRTREIGVRRAVGARRRDVVREVLFEAAAVAVAGGAVGLGVVALLTRLAAGAVDLELAVSPRTAATALGAAALAGIVAGWYPARRAARVDVIDALRIE
jgi:putative ABC transport system permease protein